MTENNRETVMDLARECANQPFGYNDHLPPEEKEVDKSHHREDEPFGERLRPSGVRFL